MTRALLVLLFLLAFPAMAWAGPAGGAHKYDALDTLWVLLAAFLVFFMQAGFGMVEAGLIRAKNATNILMKNLLDFCFASVGFFICGYALMFGGKGAIMGTEGFFLAGATVPETAPTLPLHAFWLFQAVFVGAAATIVAGGVAERMKFSAYLAYSFVISAFVYPIVGHWVWAPGGWLGNLGFHDFAGSTVVHALGGFTALIGAWMVGPRLGKYGPDGTPRAIGGHNMPLVALGVFILWLGWFGFNPGSTLGMKDPELVARIAINTNLAASAAAVSGMLTAWVKFKKPGLDLALNGALAGLVGITAGCASVSPGSALFIGIAAGVLSVFGVGWLDRLQVDDPVGAVPVHCLCGIWGTLAVGLWGQKSLGAPHDGLFYGGGVHQLGVQLLGVAACLGFVGVSMGIVFKAIDSIIGLRVDEETELCGLDIGEHGMESYSGFQIFVTE
ncbi:MAG: ammonium transporter [Planctomycetota bacterium]